MRLPKKINYSTHLPILKAVCKTFSPTGVLELGCGKHSTPFFYNYNGNVVSLESDEEWCDKISKKCPDSNKFKLIYHNLGEGVTRKTTYKQFPMVEIKNMESFYDSILDKYDLNFLFVDNWKSVRYRSIRYLANKFDIIVYHDAEDKNKQYKYNLLIYNPIRGFFHWIYCPFSTQTGILINEKFRDKLEIFDKNIHSYSNEFCERMGKKYRHKIKNIGD